MLVTYLCLALALFTPAKQNDAVERAIKYLSREVPAWSKDNHCFSCHNNGDGARALYVARALSLQVPDAALADTTEWLRKPSAWDESKREAGFSDKRLARIEFGNALVEAFDSGLIKDEGSIREAAEPLMASQDPSGAWTVDTESVVAAPARYGPVLATYMARRILERSRDARMAASIKRANEFLLQTPMQNVMNASAVLMAFAHATDAQGGKRAQDALDFIQSAEASDGGWGPYPKTPTEVFDTAIAILALSEVKNRPGVADRIRRGREYLISMQLEDGGWIETTRPAGLRSYAQHISTCGWATIALLRTREKISPPGQEGQTRAIVFDRERRGGRSSNR